MIDRFGYRRLREVHYDYVEAEEARRVELSLWIDNAAETETNKWCVRKVAPALTINSNSSEQSARDHFAREVIRFKKEAKAIVEAGGAASVRFVVGSFTSDEVA